MKLRLFSETIGMPVMTDYLDQPLDYVRDIIIDPENGSITVFRLSRGNVISSYDVVEWNNRLLIQDESHIVPLEEVLRAKVVFEQRVPFFGNKVETERGEYIGRVYDMTFNAETFSLHQLFVARGFFIFRWFHVIIPAANITKITRAKIIVRSGVEKKREKISAATLEPA